MTTQALERPSATDTFDNQLSNKISSLDPNDYRDIDLRRRYILPDTLQQHLNTFKGKFLKEIEKEAKLAKKNKSVSLKLGKIVLQAMEEDALFNMKLILIYRRNISNKIKQQTLFNLCHNYCKLYTSKHYRKGLLNDS